MVNVFIGIPLSVIRVSAPFGACLAKKAGLKNGCGRHPNGTKKKRLADAKILRRCDAEVSMHSEE
ncbi:hypothetical protein HMPREF9555_01730 [Selenomonas artemidis F0399]|uniref:Uncharacterized protein n=1 Tax=Selenomonas artemidis F0399 TaxID=749551 RepID=E7N3Z1_9FIRM|nr:hypothetical protein HMPREF9555_01730 [Selenomonas artemidis F0399]